ncbi:hypothetical protein ESCO_002886 [Escovopsis weberi]|uniref:Magnesium transport protein CorA n=1 Tax=Escovopsis weberi TaxID=150374 RepID=A0A0M8N1D8_ESCWE|nr:hypothetical protein ESCO_002886 [Escovopsis weberi]
MWWTTFARRSNGYFGYQDILCPEGKRAAITTWVRFIVKRLGPRDQYYWAKLNAFVHFLPSDPPRTSVLVFDPHPTIAACPSARLLDEPSLPRDSLVRSLFSHISDAELADPFWPYPRMLLDILRVQDLAVWETTAFVRAVEKKRAFQNINSTADLQQIPRHTLHVFETLCVAETTLQSIRDHHRQYFSGPGIVFSSSSNNTSSASLSSSTSTMCPQAGVPAAPGLASANIHHRLAHHHHILSSLRHRSSSSLSRITTQITLTYNEIASRDAQVMRVDSSAMRAIAFVTMAFLPATFVSAIFGTGFFSYDAPTGEWGVSPKFWIFWAVAVPVTVATMGAWLYWTRRFLDDARAQEDDREVRKFLMDAHLVGHGSVEKLPSF